jgi:hypothetical protein
MSIPTVSGAGAGNPLEVVAKQFDSNKGLDDHII